MRAKYPSDITRKQFSLIENDLFTFKNNTHPRDIDLYHVFCGVLYRIKEGCSWRSLPHDYPNWQICYYYYNLWRTAEDGQESLLDKVLRKLVEEERKKNGRNAETTMIIVDSKSIKNTDTAEEKGYDAGKKNFRSKASHRC